MKATIRTWEDGEFRDVAVDAAPCGVPGLAIHAAHRADGWIITHLGTGCRVAWFPDADPEWVLACAQALGELGDWAGDVRLLILPARRVLDEYGAGRSNGPVPAAALRAEQERLMPLLRGAVPR